MPGRVTLHLNSRKNEVLPFTHAQFLEVFAQYNAAVWPAQVFAYVIACGMAAMLLLRRPPARDALIVSALALMWLWTGIGYHWMYFTLVNKAAWGFGALFIVQGLLLVRAASKSELRFGAGSSACSRRLGWALIAYASVIYPLIGLALGPGYPQLPMFGITPCPVTIFTFGFLLLATTRVPRSLLVIPVLWSLVGGSAAVLLNVPQDWVLLLSGASVFLLRRDERRTVIARPA